MIAIPQESRVASISRTQASDVSQQSLATGSVNAVRLIKPDKRQYLHHSKRKTQVVCQACNAPFIGGSNAQPAVQLSVDSIKVKLQEEIEGTRRGIFGIKASACVLTAALGGIVMKASDPHTACESLRHCSCCTGCKKPGN